MTLAAGVDDGWFIQTEHVHEGVDAGRDEYSFEVMASFCGGAKNGLPAAQLLTSAGLPAAQLPTSAGLPAAQLLKKVDGMHPEVGLSHHTLLALLDDAVPTGVAGIRGAMAALVAAFDSADHTKFHDDAEPRVRYPGREGTYMREYYQTRDKLRDTLSYWLLHTGMRAVTLDFEPEVEMCPENARMFDGSSCRRYAKGVSFLAGNEVHGYHRAWIWVRVEREGIVAKRPASPILDVDAAGDVQAVDVG